MRTWHYLPIPFDLRKTSSSTAGPLANTSKLPNPSSWFLFLSTTDYWCEVPRRWDLKSSCICKSLLKTVMPFWEQETVWGSSLFCAPENIIVGVLAFFFPFDNLPYSPVLFPSVVLWEWVRGFDKNEHICAAPLVISKANHSIISFQNLCVFIL